MEWVPGARLFVENVATPALRTPVPSVVVPSEKVTVPVAVDGETVAVNVMFVPCGAAVELEVSVVVVGDSEDVRVRKAVTPG